jgi:hypothetical protein
MGLLAPLVRQAFPSIIMIESHLELYFFDNGPTSINPLRLCRPRSSTLRSAACFLAVRFPAAIATASDDGHAYMMFAIWRHIIPMTESSINTRTSSGKRPKSKKLWRLGETKWALIVQ